MIDDQVLEFEVELKNDTSTSHPVITPLTVVNANESVVQHGPVDAMTEFKLGSLKLQETGTTVASVRLAPSGALNWISPVMFGIPKWPLMLTGVKEAPV